MSITIIMDMPWSSMIDTAFSSWAMPLEFLEDRREYRRVLPPRATDDFIAPGGSNCSSCIWSMARLTPGCAALKKPGGTGMCIFSPMQRLERNLLTNTCCFKDSQPPMTAIDLARHCGLAGDRRRLLRRQLTAGPGCLDGLCCYAPDSPWS